MQLISFSGSAPVRATGVLGHMCGQLDQGAGHRQGALPPAHVRPDGGGRLADLHLGHPRAAGGHVVPRGPGLVRLRHRRLRKPGEVASVPLPRLRQRR